jgi:hypothetical protein
LYCVFFFSCLRENKELGLRTSCAKELCYQSAGRFTPAGKDACRDICYWSSSTRKAVLVMPVRIIYSRFWNVSVRYIQNQSNISAQGGSSQAVNFLWRC